jgi:DNA-binding response OmpR family regulator
MNGLTLDPSPTRPMILIVDDEVIIAETLRTIVMNSGFASLALYDAPAALEMARVVPPDLLLTDFVLPGMNGLELAIQVLEACPACKIIIFSALVSVADMTLMSAPGNHEFVFLEKPVHPKTLLAQVRNLLQPSTMARPAGPREIDPGSGPISSPQA